MVSIPIKSIKKYYSLFIIIIIISILLFVSHSQQLETTIESNPQFKKRDYDKRLYYVIEVEDDSITTPKDVENLLSIRHEERVGELDNYHLFSRAKEEIVVGDHDKRSSPIFPE